MNLSTSEILTIVAMFGSALVTVVGLVWTASTIKVDLHAGLAAAKGDLSSGLAAVEKRLTDKLHDDQITTARQFASLTNQFAGQVAENSSMAEAVNTQAREQRAIRDRLQTQGERLAIAEHALGIHAKQPG